MPPDPKKPIEELLEASARGRRAEFGADPKMPNPMRARLHYEIARLDREAQPVRRRSWLAAFWPQISIAAAVLVTASVLWLGQRSDSGSESRQVAMREASDAQLDAALKSQVAAKTESAAAETFRAGAVASGSLADNTAALKPADVAIASAAPAAPARSDDAARELNERANQIAQAPVVAANAPSENFAGAQAGAPAFKKEAGRGNLQQQFSQTARGQALRSNAKLKQAANVLNTFQVEQDGRQIRVVDADGSTYTGKLEAVAQNAGRSMARAEPKAAAPAAAAARERAQDSSSSENEFSFRATGYNDSLKKEVVFEGNYIAPATPQKSADFQKDGQAPARIVGTAKVPGESPVEVDAVAVSR
jgi:hypothetical protein